MDKHNLRYTIYIGDGDSASHKAIVEAAPYGDTIVTKSDCTGHVQKRMGTSLTRLILETKEKAVIPTPEGQPQRKGIQGKKGLTKKLMDQIQNYYGLAIRGNIGNKEGMIKAINAIFGHLSNDHQYCPDDETTWCKYQRKDPVYKPKDIAPGVLALMKPSFERLSDPEFLEMVQRGDSQNPNEALHSLIWKRAPKHIFASPEAIRVSTALAVIHRNAGNVGLVKVLEAMNINNNNITCSALEKLDRFKEAGKRKKQNPEIKKQRQIIRGIRKRGLDLLKETEEPSYKTGAFDLPDTDVPGESETAKKRQPRNKTGQTARPAEMQPAKRKQTTKRPAKRPECTSTTTDDGMLQLLRAMLFIWTVSLQQFNL